jgi:hypothetical protein
MNRVHADTPPKIKKKEKEESINLCDDDLYSDRTCTGLHGVISHSQCCEYLKSNTNKKVCPMGFKMVYESTGTLLCTQFVISPNGTYKSVHTSLIFLMHHNL